jgi:hypothetical protein
MKTDAIDKEIKKITARTGRGLSMSSLNDSTWVIRRYPRPVLIIEIVIFPRKKIRDPIPFVMKKVAAFFKANTKAAIAAEQKDSPVSAI